MSSNAMESQGTKIQHGTGSGPITYSDLAEIKGFNGPNGTASIKDVSDLASTAKEKRMGLPDEGQMSLPIHFIADDAKQLELREARRNRTLEPFKILWTDAGDTVWTFNAYVTGFSVSGAVDDVVTGNITLEIDGAITES